VAGTCEYGDEPSGSKNAWNFLTSCRTSLLFKKDSAPWSKYYKLSTVHINPFRLSPSHCVTESQYFRFSVKIFSRPVLPGGVGGCGERNNFFHRGPNPLSAAQVFVSCVRKKICVVIDL
jgi:hypothetical protein